MLFYNQVVTRVIAVNNTNSTIHYKVGRVDMLCVTFCSLRRHDSWYIKFHYKPIDLPDYLECFAPRKP